MTAGMLAWQDGETEAAYQDLSLSTVGDGTRIHPENDRENVAVDWDALIQQNPDTVGWLEVDGTPIDYPVVQPSDQVPSDYYLTHDFWNRSSEMGCPYLDTRCDPSGRHRLIFGHHLGLTDHMFSTLFQTWKQAEFDRIGSAIWEAADGSETTFRPLCALKVDMSFETIQRFSFDEDDELRSWLLELVGDSSAQADGATAQVEEATSAMTLVTCSSTIANQRERTLLVFTA